MFGTVLNRFIVQAVIGHPLTVYGAGGQTRGFLDIVDTVRCLEIAADQPVEPGEFRVFNQFTESFSVLELAELVAALYQGHVRIEHLDNPRVEMDQHYYHAAHDGLLRLGLEPHLLSAALVESGFETVQRHRNRIDTRVILPLSRWKPDLAAQEPPEAPVPSGAAVGG